MASLFYAAIAALANVAGAFALTLGGAWSRRSLEFVLAYSAGFLIAVSLGELVPEAIARGGTTAGLWMLGGFVAVHLTQHALVRHFHFGEETHAVGRNVASSALIGLTLHTLVDGVAIASSFSVSPKMGFMVLAAIGLHKLPEGLAIGSLMLASGRKPAAAVGAAAMLGVATIVGAALTTQLSLLAEHGLAISAGVTLYVAAANLIPEFQSRGGWRHNAWFFGGVETYVIAEWLSK